MCKEESDFVIFLIRPGYNGRCCPKPYKKALRKKDVKSFRDCGDDGDYTTIIIEDKIYEVLHTFKDVCDLLNAKNPPEYSI